MRSLVAMFIVMLMVASCGGGSGQPDPGENPNLVDPSGTWQVQVVGDASDNAVWILDGSRPAFTLYQESIGDDNRFGTMTFNENAWTLDGTIQDGSTTTEYAGSGSVTETSISGSLTMTEYENGEIVDTVTFNITGTR